MRKLRETYFFREHFYKIKNPLFLHFIFRRRCWLAKIGDRGGDGGWVTGMGCIKKKVLGIMEMEGVCVCMKRCNLWRNKKVYEKKVSSYSI